MVRPRGLAPHTGPLLLPSACPPPASLPSASRLWFHSSPEKNVLQGLWEISQGVTSPGGIYEASDTSAGSQSPHPAPAAPTPGLWLHAPHLMGCLQAARGCGRSEGMRPQLSPAGKHNGALSPRGRSP